LERGVIICILADSLSEIDKLENDKISKMDNFINVFFDEFEDDDASDDAADQDYTNISGRIKLNRTFIFCFYNSCFFRDKI
jgi:hypothetical protein